MSALAVQNVEVLSIGPFLLALAAVYGFIFIRLIMRLRRIGYQSPFTKLLLLGAYFAAIGLGVFNMWWQSDICWSCTPEVPRNMRSLRLEDI
jgi:hypothetical protein